MVVSISCTVIMVALFISSLSEYLTTSTMSQMLIDDSSSEAKLKIIFSIEFPSVPCDLIYMDSRDLIGFAAEDLQNDISRKRMVNGVVQSRERWMRNEGVTYEDVKVKIKKGEGCFIEGSTMVNKVPGNVHFSMHNEKVAAIAQRLSAEGVRVNFAHKIVHFSFGSHEHQAKSIQKKYPEIDLFPLEGTSMNEDIRLPIAYQYYLNVVRTVVEMSGKPVELYQYTISKSYGLTHDMPALFFKYEMSPLYVRYEIKQKSIWHFIVNVCATHVPVSYTHLTLPTTPYV
eukprot:TRINITY_DN7825_c0_g1_i8.p1 TRINITY_DN7825_c0_g1~~TRINITY_DN7825_c0_g1_i8.p1  ORF type:complete len:286 (-),score=88.41 TRINITY_DN7825_c0_g1_i8:47-904(-)